MATLLAIELLDELVFGAREAAWPLIRDDLSLSYTQIGLLLSVPGLVSLVVEPALGIASVTWRRRALVLGGGALFRGRARPRGRRSVVLGPARGVLARSTRPPERSSRSRRPR